jgi:hypothetical protein
MFLVARSMYWIQGLSKLPKFKPRSNWGMFVGYSKKHSSLVPLVLNFETLTITPQFHIVFDDWFTSVVSLTPVDVDALLLSLWDDSRYKYHFDDEDDIRLQDDWQVIDHEHVDDDVDEPADGFQRELEQPPLHVNNEIINNDNNIKLDQQHSTTTSSNNNQSTTTTSPNLQQTYMPSPISFDNINTPQ